MANLFTMLPFSVNNPGLPVIPPNDYQRLVDLEVSAKEHWIFDEGAASVVGKLNDQVLTAQSTPPSYPANYMRISGDEGKGMLTPWGEVVGQTDTIAVVFKFNASASLAVFPFGTLGKGSDPAPVTGGCPWLSTPSHDLLITYRGIVALGSVDTTDDMPGDTWLFLCVSRAMTASGSVIAMKGGSVPRAYSGNYSAYQPAAAGRKIALGSAYYNSQLGNTLDFAEAIVFDRALNATEINELYLRSKARMAERGITVL